MRRVATTMISTGSQLNVILWVKVCLQEITDSHFTGDPIEQEATQMLLKLHSRVKKKRIGINLNEQASQGILEDEGQKQSLLPRHEDGFSRKKVKFTMPASERISIIIVFIYMTLETILLFINLHNMTEKDVFL